MRKHVPRLAAAAIAIAALVALPTMSAAASEQQSTSTTAKTSASASWTDLASADEPDSNPLKGFIPFEGSYTTFPHSMEWSYFPLNAVMTGPDTFDWSALDTALDDIKSRGHQTALRFYLDYPGKASGIPQYLLDDGLVTHSYDDYDNDGKSVSPDYDDTNLRAALDTFIKALGARYDGDSRIGYLQAGLIGFWGEWHTYPYNGTDGNDNWMASDSTQLEVLDDFVNAFHTTQLEVRNPTTQNADLAIGYHDDSFALETKTSSLGWHFMDNMAAAGATDKWKKYSIGGELRPELQSCIFSSDGCAAIEDGGDNDFAGSVSETHASWMINQYAFGTGYSDSDKATALAGAKSLGYSFRATEALVPGTASATADVGVTISNIGVAPFYYKWPITLAYVNSDGSTAKQVTTDWDVSDIASGSSKTFTTSLDVSDLASGKYTLVAQVTNPMSGGQPIRFANDGQDTTKDGWLTLGTTTVSAASSSAHTVGHHVGTAHHHRGGAQHTRGGARHHGAARTLR